MFNSPILDLVILLSFTYFVGSIMLTAINEAIAAGLKTRAKDLAYAIENLFLNNPQWKQFVLDKFNQSAFIQSLMNNAQQHPSYIPAKNFVLTIIEQLNPNEYNAEKITTAIKNSELPQIAKNLLLTLWAKCEAKTTEGVDKIKLFEEELEAFYNNSMERASGWFKRKTRRILLVMGFVLSIILNLDTIAIVNASLKDKNKLSQTVDGIVNQLQNINVTDSIITISDSANGVYITQILKQDTANKKNIKATADSTTKTIKGLSVFYQKTTDINLGYADFKEFKLLWFGCGSGKNCWYGLGLFLIKLIGVIITAFALQLGSNYWFDMLNKAVNLRASGKKPQ